MGCCRNQTESDELFISSVPESSFPKCFVCFFVNIIPYKNKQILSGGGGGFEGWGKLSGNHLEELSIQI